ncbi:MAG TPA: phosphatase PAP2 family protein [Solirubrobacteraceae bacterium]|nr:phosphatase PAP2 family protein [Solirubrobacteraceae bacterium]
MITRPLSLIGRRELFLFLGAYLLYSMSRYLSVGDLSTATGHAEWIVNLQQSIGVNIEASVQSALDGTAVIWVLNNLYLAAQLIVVPGTLIWLYRRNHELYVKLRNTVLATWLIAMPIYALFPVAPPRLADIGMLDTITSGGGVRLDSALTTSFYNPLAAVPSLHSGFALAVGVALAVYFSNRWAKLLAISWAPIIGLAVVATGNHFVFDIAAGLVVTVAGYVVGNAVDRRFAGRGPWRRPVVQVPGSGSPAPA